MTNPDDKGKPETTPQGNAPSWVDEVLGSSKAAPPTPAPAPASAAPGTTPPLTGPADLKIPETRPSAPPPPASAGSGDDWVARATGGTAKAPQMPTGPDVTPRPTQSTSEVLSDFMRPIVNEVGGRTAAGPASPPQAQAQPADPWPSTPQPSTPPVPYPNQPYQGRTSSDISQKKLIAGLLGIFLGSLGVHKFYLGMNQAGIIMLAATIGGWILGVIGSFIIVGAVFFLVPMIVSIVGLIEGIIYLTKSDADFEREYVIGKKQWL